MSPVISTRKKIAVRCAFGGLLIVVVLQLLITRLIGEPYPAIAMPDFSGDGGYRDNRVTITTFDAVFVFQDGSTLVLASTQLLSQYPDSYHSTIATVAFDWQSQNWFTSQPRVRENWRYRLFPGLYAGFIDRWTELNQTSLRSWLVDKAASLRPDVQLDRVKIDWYRDTFSFRDGQLTSAWEPLGSLVIPITP